MNWPTEPKVYISRNMDYAVTPEVASEIRGIVATSRNAPAVKYAAAPRKKEFTLTVHPRDLVAMKNFFNA